MTQARYQTLRHIETVRNYLNACIRELMARQEVHDQSKLEAPEAEAFEVMTSRLRGLTYGSLEYKESLAEYAPAIRHHYEENRHHPEHFPQGIHDMNLIDVLEMLCDWKAATLRHDNGDIWESLKINTERFALSPQMVDVFTNTILWLDSLEVHHHAEES